MTGRVQAWVTVAIALAMTETVLQRRGALMAFTHQRGRNDPRRNAARGA
jgi:heme exporter protein D